MGEKDLQQLYLVKKYIQKKYNSRIILCKTIRNKDNLALSSRNSLLSKTELKKASKFTQQVFSLKKKLGLIEDIEKFLRNKRKEFNKLFGIKIEYLELRNNRNFKKTKSIKNSKLFLAYYINKIRLIDNI